MNPLTPDAATALLYVPAVGHPSGAAPLHSHYQRSRSATGRLASFLRERSTTPSQSAMMTAVASPPSQSLTSSPKAPDLNTLPDPRAPSPLPSGASTPSKGQQHPDLSNEVAQLSTKLINAINHQTNLDDALQEARHDLEAARERIAQLENDAKRHQDAVASGVLVRRADSAKVEEQLQSTIADERKRRDSAERGRRGMELELETLTSQLFEEANEMVASARHEKETTEKKSDQLRAKLRETEILLASHQDQLSELKTVLSAVQSRPRDSIQTVSTAPVTPAVGPNEKMSSKTFELPGHRRNAHSLHNIQAPESPLHFSHLIHPVVRTDVQAYEDFINLLRTNKGGTSPSRTTSGSYTGLNVLGLGSKDLSTQSMVVPGQQNGPVNGSSRNASAQNTPTIAGHSPNLSNENNSYPSTLKEARYYKRALVEDIEPTLRLDTAPGLSFLSRRTVLTSMTTGKLIVEPYPSRHPFHSPAFACSLCGETRPSEEHLRKFRFRTSDSDEAQRYPVCNYCLSRVRSTCDFLGFLREARKGNMRNETIDDCRIAWEECVRLRERMFWSRVGGGVIPAPGAESPMMPGVYTDSIHASQSDSDLPGLERTRSNLSHASERRERTPLSRVTSSDQVTSDTAPDERRITEARSNGALRKPPSLAQFHSMADLAASPSNSPMQTQPGSAYSETSTQDVRGGLSSAQPAFPDTIDPSPLRTEQRFSQISASGAAEVSEPQVETQRPLPPAPDLSRSPEVAPQEEPQSMSVNTLPPNGQESQSVPAQPLSAPSIPPELESTSTSATASLSATNPNPTQTLAPQQHQQQPTRNKIAALASRFQLTDASTTNSPSTQSPTASAAHSPSRPGSSQTSRPGTPGTRLAGGGGAGSPERRGRSVVNGTGTARSGADGEDGERKRSEVRIPGAFS